MKASEWRRAAVPLREAIPTFRAMKRGLVRESEWLAECIYADSSSFSKERFFLEAFVLPLFIPTEHLYFDYGFRVGSQWERVDDQLVAAVVDALPRLERLATWPALVDMAGNWRINIRHAELRFCVGVLAPDPTLVQESRAVLASWEPSADWEQDVVDRQRELAAVLDHDGREAAVDQLASRRAEVVGLLA